VGLDHTLPLVGQENLRPVALLPGHQSFIVLVENGETLNRLE
jgi:hypothetical protein